LIFHQTTFGRAFVFGRADWEYVLNTFAFAYAVGYHFVDRPTGSTNGQFVGIGVDAANNASVLVEQSKQFGIAIVNGEFTAFCDRGNPADPPHTGHPENFCRPNDPTVAPVHVQTLPNNTGAVKFTSSSFWGPSHAVAVADGTGIMSFIGCTVLGFRLKLAVARRCYWIARLLYWLDSHRMHVCPPRPPRVSFLLQLPQ
jgi:hypothetical protein